MFQYFDIWLLLKMAGVIYLISAIAVYFYTPTIHKISETSRELDGHVSSIVIVFLTICPVLNTSLAILITWGYFVDAYRWTRLELYRINFRRKVIWMSIVDANRTVNKIIAEDRKKEKEKAEQSN